jgi:hypothetical protein
MPIVLTSHDRHDRNLTVLVLKLDLVLAGLAACDTVPEYEIEADCGR